MTLDDASRLYVRLVLVLCKLYDNRALGKTYVKHIEPALKEAQLGGNISAEARLLYAKQRIVQALAWRD